jgi:hypothetical protein
MSANIRSLIERALHEAQEEFAAIVQRKLAELMGDVPAEPPARGRKSVKVGAPARAPAAKDPRPSTRTRAPRDHMSALRERVLDALRSGEPMKRSQVVSAAGLAEDDGQRVGLVLKRLKDEGLLVMRGQKAAATYALKAGRRRERDDAGEPEPGES